MQNLKLQDLIKLKTAAFVLATTNWGNFYLLFKITLQSLLIFMLNLP